MPGKNEGKISQIIGPVVDVIFEESQNNLPKIYDALEVIKNDGEKLIDAMKRELEEETGIKNIKILKEVNGWSEYELPDYLLGKLWRGKYRGQKQKWFVVRFLGNDSEINLKTSKPEFIEWQWLNIENLTKVIVHFKRKVYEKLLPEIKSSIN